MKSSRNRSWNSSRSSSEKNLRFSDSASFFYFFLPKIFETLGINILVSSIQRLASNIYLALLFPDC